MPEEIDNVIKEFKPIKNFGKGMTGKKHSEETKRKMRIRMLGNVINIGRVSPLRGRKLSEETCKKISSTFIKKGQHLSVETEFKKGDKRIYEHIGVNHKNYKGGISVGENRIPYIVAIRRKRDALKRGSTGTHGLQDWLNLKKKYNYMCLACKKKEPEIILTEDHVIPLVNKGSHSIANIQPLCRSCNAKKFTKIIDYRYAYE